MDGVDALCDDSVDLESEVVGLLELFGLTSFVAGEVSSLLF